MVRMSRTAFLLLGTLAVATACGKKRASATPTPEPTTTVPTAPVGDPEADRRAAAERERAERDRMERERMERERAARIEEVRRMLAERIYFGYDRSDLTSAARATLDTKLAYLRANPDVRIRIAGHADDRGSDEYNLTLGQSRAAAAKRYFVQRGIDAARIEIISYGEEMPLVQGEDESAWSQNRRCEFEITAGNVMARTP